MPKAKQFSVSVENRPGTLARVATVLGDAKVNILAFLTTTSNAEGAVHVVVDNVDKARSALDREKLSLTEADVLAGPGERGSGSIGLLDGFGFGSP